MNNPLAADERDRSNGNGAEECPCAGAGHEDAEAGFVGAENVTREVGNEGEKGIASRLAIATRSTREDMAGCWKT